MSAAGVVDPSDLSFGYAWANARQPRTMAGVDARGRLILATVDSRQSGGSEGFTLQEAAAFMCSLGAGDALNLGGGGSTAMAVGGVLVNKPSNAAGERAERGKDFSTGEALRRPVSGRPQNHTTPGTPNPKIHTATAT